MRHNRRWRRRQRYYLMRYWSQFTDDELLAMVR